MGDLTTNFSRAEFACKCGCGLDRISPSLVKQIQQFRNLLWISVGEEIRITVTSGCRCHPYNEKIGGTKNSFHVKGLAADITFGGAAPILRKSSPPLIGGRLVCLARCLKMMTVGGVGVYPDRNFMHLDVRAELITWINENGVYRFGVDFAAEIRKGAG